MKKNENKIQVEPLVFTLVGSNFLAARLGVSGLLLGVSIWGGVKVAIVLERWALGGAFVTLGADLLMLKSRLGAKYPVACAGLLW